MKKRRFKIKLMVLCWMAGIVMVMGFMGLPICSAEQKAVSINWAPDFSSGANSVIPVDPVGGPRTVQNNLNPTISDLGLNSFGRHFYVIERYMGDNITKYDIENPAVPLWQYSIIGEGDVLTSVNPHNIVFVSEKKAYLMRYNDYQAWIINPDAQNEADFKIGTLNLSDYNDQDGLGPEMTNGVIVGNQLFVLMQRLDQDNNWEPQEAFVAVFDIRTDQEITTGKHDTLKGIPLPVKNPSDIVYEAATKMIYVQGEGKRENDWSGIPAEYSGGIAVIDPLTYDTSLIIDDGDDDNHPYGNISGMTILSAEKGYFIGYLGWGNNTLYEFNPSTGHVAGTVHPSLSGKNITKAEADQNGRLWVANASDGQIVVINPEDNSIDEIIDTDLNPEKIVFVSYSTNSPEGERVFNWAQSQLPDLLPVQGMLSIDIEGWYVRYYPLTNTYLGAFEDRFYFYQPSVSPEVFDLGPIMDEWLEYAAENGF